MTSNSRCPIRAWVWSHTWLMRSLPVTTFSLKNASSSPNMPKLLGKGWDQRVAPHPCQSGMIYADNLQQQPHQVQKPEPPSTAPHSILSASSSAVFPEPWWKVLIKMSRSGLSILIRIIKKIQQQSFENRFLIRLVQMLTTYHQDTG